MELGLGVGLLSKWKRRDVIIGVLNKTTFLFIFFFFIFKK